MASRVLRTGAERGRTSGGHEFLAALDDARHEPVGNRLLGRHPEVALDVLQHAFQGLAGLARDDLGNALPGLDDLLGLDRDIARRSTGTAARLVDQETGLRQAEASLAWRPQVEMGGCAADPACAHHVDGRGNEAHDIMDRIARFEVAPPGRTRSW